MAGIAPITPDSLQKEIETRERPIDLIHLSRQTLGDPGLEQEILALFSKIAAQYLANVADTLDPKEMEQGLHALKGAAAGVGARAVANEAAEAETELRETGKLSAERLSDLAIAVEEVRVFISGFVAQ